MFNFINLIRENKSNDILRSLKHWYDVKYLSQSKHSNDWLKPHNWFYIKSLQLNHYLGYNSVIETSFLDKGIATDSDSEDSVTLELCSIEDDRSDWYVLLFIKNAGWEGICNVREELLSMRTTEAIVGLSATFSWTQSNPMWMHLNISVAEPLLKTGSIISWAVPSLQFLHAYKIYPKWIHNIEGLADIPIKPWITCLICGLFYTYMAQKVLYVISIAKTIFFTSHNLQN